MVDEDVDFNMWEDPTVTDVRAHIRMCRYIEWQQKIQAKQEKLAELGMSATHVRRLMKRNQEEARKAREE